ncbi:phage integrase SAM-like domain-containing protein [Bacteroides sp. KG122]|uniref:phage integrase SAM-like domain-containing protein n=1 Tax=unclassified Bacteroides TaxID=2646097 RepID=UPI003D9817BA
MVNWRRVGELLKMYSQGQPIPFKAISVKLLEDIKMFLLRASMGGNKKGTISQNTASTYFSILKTGLKQAFIDEYLTVDISVKVKGITNIEKSRVALTMNEVQMLVDTPCKDDVFERAFLFSILQSEIDDWLKNKSHKTQDDLMLEAQRFVESKKIIR